LSIVEDLGVCDATVDMDPAERNTEVILGTRTQRAGPEKTNFCSRNPDQRAPSASKRRLQ